MLLLVASALGFGISMFSLNPLRIYVIIKSYMKFRTSRAEVLNSTAELVVTQKYNRRRGFFERSRVWRLPFTPIRG